MFGCSLSLSFSLHFVFAASQPTKRQSQWISKSVDFSFVSVTPSTSKTAICFSAVLFGRALVQCFAGFIPCPIQLHANKQAFGAAHPVRPAQRSRPPPSNSAKKLNWYTIRPLVFVCANKKRKSFVQAYQSSRFCSDHWVCNGCCCCLCHCNPRVIRRANADRAEKSSSRTR